MNYRSTGTKINCETTRDGELTNSGNCGGISLIPTTDGLVDKIIEVDKHLREEQEG